MERAHIIRFKMFLLTEQAELTQDHTALWLHSEPSSLADII